MRDIADNEEGKKLRTLPHERYQGKPARKTTNGETGGKKL